ncbi:MAG: hypothetical protein AAF533_14010 [Acidobacteriota bacterium]
MGHDRNMELRYRLDAQDRLTWVSSAWTEFATENQAPELRPEAIVNRPIWSFIADAETRSVYRQLFSHARGKREPVRFPYRCDGPEARRLMELAIEPEGDELVVCSRMVNEEATPRLRLLERDAERGEEVVSICSNCRRVRADNGRWLEPLDAARRLGLFARIVQPRLQERICPSCESIAEGCRYLLTEPEGGLDEASGPVPVVVFLHGAGQARWLMRLDAPPRRSEMQPGGYLLVSPVLRSGRWDVDELSSILDEVLAENAVVSDDVRATGVSIGATACWRWAGLRRGSFSRLLLVAGVLPLFDGLRSVPPTWAVHGARDPIVPLAMVEPVLRELGTSPDNRVTILEDGGHDIWSRVYSRPDAWDWLLERDIEESGR